MYYVNYFFKNQMLEIQITNIYIYIMIIGDG